MTKVTIISGESLNSYYEERLQYLLNTYHNHPSQLTPSNLEQYERNEANPHKAGTGRTSARGEEFCGDGYDGDTPLGKLVV